LEAKLSILLTADVWHEISRAATENAKPAQVAVAYFGQDGARLLPLSKGSSLVVDASLLTVAQGATCPAALEQLRKKGVEIYSSQYLHAKAFAFDKVGFVGSANASSHSASMLIEAVLKVETHKEVSAIRGFVSSLCITQLSATDLKDLGEFYRRPKYPKPEPKQGLFCTLLMELTYEQGIDRITQVQPPKDVWTNFFGISPWKGELPRITLVNEKVIPNTEMKRYVVRHHHTYTIEIADAALPRPAILQVRRLGQRRYGYLVHRPSDSTFANIDHLVRTVPNPMWQSGRRWVLV
jgi:hypothetical protein